MEELTTVVSLLSENSGLLAGGSVAALVLWVLKSVPNEQIQNLVSTFFFGIGRTMTLGLSKWKFTKGTWNQVIEPWLIDLVDNVVGGAVKGFIDGLRVDND
jgi:hypothetical protein